MMRAACANLIPLVGGSVAAAASSSTTPRRERANQQFERALSGSGDEISYDDDFWAYDQDQLMNVYWDDYSIEPRKCMVYKNKHVIAFDLYGKGNKQCAKKKEGTYIMDVGKFARAYVAQKQVDYKLMGKNYGGADALGYVDCTMVEYNDVYYYSKLGCSTQGGLKLITYTDESCTQEVSTNIGVYNDIKIQFNVCQTCVSWPSAAGDDDKAEEADVDDNFEVYHPYDSKICGAAAQYRESCGWGCKRTIKKSMSSSSSHNNPHMKRSWGSFEKFCLFFWSFAAIALVWVVLKQRRMMSREDAIVEEAAMNGVGLKKRHVFPIAIGIIFSILLSIFMAWKELTWILLIGTDIGLFANFVFLRRKAKKSGVGGEGYVKDAGLEIS